MSYFKKLKDKWGLESAKQVVIVLVVFALTGTTVLVIKNPVLSLFTENGEVATWAKVTYYILILPIYNVILLGYGFLLGQFDFFFEYEKKMLRRMRIIKNNSKDSDLKQDETS